MSSVVIHAEGLSKRYRLGVTRERYRTLQETLIRSLTMPVRATRSLLQGKSLRPPKEMFWALKDISFDVYQGDVVGIIGRNGAGKSTLLKILSKITEPTEGMATIHGRVCALLEVATGFHPELTGRENVYLNGSILGMSRREIERKFDEIVDFSGVEKFIDTPVKRYSSGMSLRLGFAVAAHLEPEVLIVDEVLAVGDLEFQRKCLGKMEQVAGEGRTVLFVSHNLAAVKSLCRRGFVLNGGSVLYDGEVGHALQVYQGMLEKVPETSGSRGIELSGIKLNDAVNQPVDFSQSIEIELWLQTKAEIYSYSLLCIIETPGGQTIMELAIQDTDYPELTSSGRYHLRLLLPPLWLTPGLYSLHFQFRPVGKDTERRYLSERIPLDVISSANVRNFFGVIYPRYDLKIEPLPDQHPEASSIS